MILDVEGWSFSAGGGIDWWGMARTLVLCFGAWLGLKGIREHNRRHKADLAERRIDRLASAYAGWLTNVQKFLVHHRDVADSRALGRLRHDRRLSDIRKALSESPESDPAEVRDRMEKKHAEVIERSLERQREYEKYRSESYEGVVAAGIKIAVDDRGSERLNAVREVLSRIDDMLASDVGVISEHFEKDKRTVLKTAHEVVSRFATDPYSLI
ncbi:MAG: hypothetical protein NXI31_11450 [bacterium]|nr:hypothetical protein [bacterium]